MLTFFLLLLNAALLYGIGAYLLRDTAIRRMHVRGDAHRLKSDDPLVRRAFESLSKAEMETGNRVELLQNGDELFPSLFADVRAAKQLITWQVFWFKPGELARQVAECLAERARAGVEVLVLLDYFGAKGLGNDYVDELREAGVKVEVFRPLHWKSLYRAPHRSHVRSIVIDGRIGYTGGFGIDDRWRGDGRRRGHWRDTHARIEGPAVDALQAPFIANWAECTGTLLFGDAVMQAQAVTGVATRAAAIMYASPSLGSTTAERYLALTIAAASESLWITSAYFVPSRGFRELLSRAVARGVDVRILTPGANTDQMLAWYAGRAHYEELSNAGVRIYEYTPTMVHAKTIVADGILVSVGSVNFDNRSMKLNDEVALVAQDGALGSALRQMFLRDLEVAQEVDVEEFRKRSHFERIKERAALLAAPLL